MKHALNSDGARRHLFLVRIWQDAGKATWNGRAVHVSSGRQFSFASLRDLSDFIALTLDLPGTETDGGAEGLNET